MKNRRLWSRLAILAAIVAAIILARLTLFAPEAVPVRTVAVERGLVEETVTNSQAGTVKARRRAKLAPEIGGKVLSLPHRRGARVRTGDLLLRVDDALQRARLALAEDEAKASLAQRDEACLSAERAARERERTERLAGEGIVSTDVLDQVESQSHAAEASCRAAAAAAERAASAVALARAELEQTVLRAPFDGIVADVFIEEGEWTSPSPPALPIPPVLDLIDMHDIYVSAPMDEVDSARIATGQPARVTVDSHPGQEFAAHVVEVAPYVADQLEQNRTVEIELELDDVAAARTLLPGTSADAEVILSTREDVLRIPTAALLEGGKVLLLADDRLVERTLDLGLRNWDFTEVTGGLERSDRVVVSLDRPEVVAGARAREEEE
ncbi:MAG: efflux RND transporter periplasmic adaptor subunit [Acidobacteria bacterium]|jgi:HlyD family secretion protein|nr:efflux RND transporter periplasmic adaptor subunit [Acidobacteriota bacterium]